MSRKDATKVVFEEPFHSIVPFIMPRRTEAEVCMEHEFSVTKLLRFIDDYNEKNGTNLKFFHCFCYALGKTIYHRPQMNYFIKGKKYWSRKTISLSFVAKQKFEDGAEEKLMFMPIKDDMTVEDISKIILGDVSKARKENSNDLDKLMRVVGKLPSFIVSLIIWFTQTLDYFGIMPSALMKGDPNYSTALISNLGSIGADACYHHLSNYGTNSIMITIGTIKDDDGDKKVNVAFTIDERIADGFYFLNSLKYMDTIMLHPTIMLDEISKGFDVC